MTKKSLVLGLVAALAATPISCARVQIRKVPSATQYSEWSDHMQSKADAIEGFRFYLPRPFVNVFESFPIRTDIYLASGVVSPDGRYVIIRSIRPESGLSNYVAGAPTLAQVPTDRILDRRSAPQAQPQSGAFPEATATAATSTGSVDTGVAGTAATSNPTATPTQPRTGMESRAVTNDNSAFAYQPLRGNIDLVYLPDFEEQFAVTSKAGLGNAQFWLNLGQGWSLQGFNSLTDNSELNRRIFDLIDTGIDAARAAAANMAAPGAGAAAGVAEQLLAPQSGGFGAAREEIAGTEVTLKIVVIHYAAKGLYPVIKPRELQERLKTDATYIMSWDLFEVFPRPTAGSEIDPKALERAGTESANETGKFTIPRYPYQYISFNTFRYMAIEAVDPEAPFGSLYDKTGTQGDPGDRRTEAPSGTSPSSMGGVNRPAVQPTATRASGAGGAGVEGSGAALARLLSGSDITISLMGISFAIAQASSPNGTKVEVILKKTSGSPSGPLTTEGLKQATVAAIDAHLAEVGQRSLDPANLIITNTAELIGEPSPAGAPTSTSDASATPELEVEAGE